MKGIQDFFVLFWKSSPKVLNDVKDVFFLNKKRINQEHPPLEDHGGAFLFSKF